MHCTMHNEYNAQGPYSSSNNQVQAPDYLVNSIAASKMKTCAEIIKWRDLSMAHQRLPPFLPEPLEIPVDTVKYIGYNFSVVPYQGLRR